jgi:acetyl-CoA carboxylase biotin carboxylase subunit
VERLIRALREYDVGGIRTNIGFFRQILEDHEFRAAHLHTGFIEEFFARTPACEAPADFAAVASLVAALHTVRGKTVGEAAAAPSATASRWLETGRGDLLR